MKLSEPAIAEIHKYASIDAIPLETRRLAVDAARSDYQAGECLPQDEIKDWLKERMGWKSV